VAPECDFATKFAVNPVARRYGSPFDTLKFERHVGEGPMLGGELKIPAWSLCAASRK
jgi:hypothetical protein